jgi:beta-lactamase class A
MTTARNIKYTWHVLTAIFFSLILLTPAVARAEAEGVVRWGISGTTLDNEYLEKDNDNNESYAEKGYRPQRLTGYVDGGATRFFLRMVENTDNRLWIASHNLTLAQFDAIFNALKYTYYLTDVSGYETPNGVRFAMLWEKNGPGAPGWQVYRNTSLAGQQTLHDTIGQQGWVPHRVEGYEINGQSFYTSIWYYQPSKGYYIHSRLTREQYQDKLDQYKTSDYWPFHVHSHAVGNTVWYSAIWKYSASNPRVYTNREGRVFQRRYNNNWAAGYNIDNFYAAATPAGVRFGGIWYFDAPVAVNENSSLGLQMRKIVDGAPALGAAAAINLTTGAEWYTHSNSKFAIASTSKIGILYALLREVDSGNASWTENINSGAQFGGNQGPDLGGPDDGPILTNTNYKVFELARLMIRNSNNWATNRLIQYVGKDVINQRLDELGLDVTRINRYMTGAGAPSLHGNSSSFADRQEGWENVSTARELVKLLRRVLQDNVLSNTSETRFWDVLGDDDDGVGENNRNYFAAQVSSMFNPDVTVFNKAGSLSTDGLRVVRADAGRFRFPDGQEVLVACIMDYITDDPDELTGASDATMTAAEQAIKDVAKAVANKYYQ